MQHKDIDEIVKLDLRTIRRIMQIVEWFVPVQGLDAYYHQIKELLEQELDFGLEADNIEIISKNFEKDPAVRFPTPVRGHSTKRVLTTTFVTGWKVSDLAALDAAGIDKKAVAKKLVEVFCQMIFVDGVYHADPHPGNILVDPEGNLILLDFGAVAQLSATMREGIPEFLEGVIRRDTDKLIKALRTMGFLSRTSDLAVSEKVVRVLSPPLPRRGENRKPQSQRHQNRPPEEPREPARFAEDERRTEGAFLGLPHPA